MTDKEKLQKLFDAALRAPAEPIVTKPALPAATRATVPAAAKPVPVAAPLPTPAVAPVQSAAVPNAAAKPAPAAPPVNAGLDEETSAELAALLDARHQRTRRKNRIGSLVTTVVFLGLAGGGYGWFVQSPQRVQAFQDAMQDIKSVGDVTSIASKYNQSLAKIKVSSDRINSATASLGVDPTKDDGKGPDLDAEMKGMMGGEGKTAGDRNRLLKEKFGAMGKSSANPGVPTPAGNAPTLPNP